MAKTYTFTDIPQPTSCSATAVAGGTLLANTTYYYRVYKCFAPSNNGGYPYGKSIISDEFSVTTDAVNRTARLTFSSPNTNGSYIVYRFTTPGVMNVYTNCLTINMTDGLHNVGGVVTFDDTGFPANTGNVYLENKDNAHGRLVLGGSTTSDRFSIVDLYNADLANGWGVIKKLGDETYQVNTYLLTTSTDFWDDIEKTIIFADGFNGFGSWYFGRVSGTNRTFAGCNIIIKSTWLVSITFGLLIAYRTSIQNVFPKNGFTDINTGLGLCHISMGGNSIVQDCTCDRSRSFTPSNTSIFTNVIVSRFDIAFSSSRATFNNVKCLSGSRVWQYGANTHVTARGVYTEGTSVILLTGSGTSTITLIDSISDGGIIVNSSSTGFKLFDQISYNLTVVDNAGTGINTANIKIYDKNNTLLFNVNSNSSGVVAEQLLTWRDRTVNHLTAGAFVTYSPFKIVVSKTGYETYEETFSVLSAVPVIKTISLKTIVPIRLLAGDGASLALQPELGSSSILKKL